MAMEATMNEFYDDIHLQCSAGGSNNGGTNDGDANGKSILTDNKTGETEKNKKIPDKKHFTKDGKIDTVTLRTGTSLSSTFNKRKNYLMQKAREIHQVTGCAISITIKPLTDRAKTDVLHFQSDNYETYTPWRLMTKKQTDRQTWSRPHTNRHNTDNTDTNRHCK